MRRIDQIKNDECFPCCVAMVLDRPRREVPYFDPCALSPDEWQTRWRDWFRAEGIHRAAIPGVAIEEVGPPARPWIAVVPSLSHSKLTHAVVMDGDRLVHDPFRWRRRQRRPRRIHLGIVLHA